MQHTALMQHPPLWSGETNLEITGYQLADSIKELKGKNTTLATGAGITQLE